MEDTLEKAMALQKRSKQFSLRVIRLFQSLPKDDVARVIGRQMLRSSTSVAANYRASCRARSKKEFAAKLGTVVEEADETLLWLELLVEAELVAQRLLQPLMSETSELLRIFSASV